MELSQKKFIVFQEVSVFPFFTICKTPVNSTLKVVNLGVEIQKTIGMLTK
jgi:hypothetical protein